METKTVKIPAKQWKGFYTVGKNHDKVDVMNKVTGSAIYTSDLYPPNMLIGRLVRSKETRAIVKSIDVKKAGRLVVALDGGAWIDLVHEGAIVKSVTHGHGPACSGIRKMVEFDVTPGRYLLQIANAPSDKIRAMALLR